MKGAGEPGSAEAEIGRIAGRLRQELRYTASLDSGDDRSRKLQPLPGRYEAERYSAISAERPYVSRAGAIGRLRGALLVPLKAVLRRLMRWYVEPPLVDQRAFNVAVLRLIDESHARASAELEQLRAQVAALERRIEDLTEGRGVDR
jgi:hypothetical protein